jgi:poly(hydroxyalkanoate) depolymerase family esterase
MLKQDMMREATRLTQAGQLAEATALLQLMLREASAPEPTSRGSDRIALRGPTIIDAKANTVEESSRLPRAKSAGPAPFRKSLNRMGSARPGFGAAVKRAPLSAQDITPVGARFIEDTFSNSAGSRSYKLFIPSGYQGQLLPLVIMLHGCTQSPDDFAAGTRMNFLADEQTCFVAYPAQRSDANHAKCWNWFRSSDQRRGEGEPSLIAGITRKVMRDYSVDPTRIYIAGLSAGAAAAAVMGATYKDLYAAIGIHSGLACGAAIDLPSAFVAMRQGSGSDRRVMPDDEPVPTIIFHGDRDTTVHPKNSDQIVEQAMKTVGTPPKRVHRGRIPGGHAYTRTTYCDANGCRILEHWNVHGAGHAWSGGSLVGSYTDPHGPDATREMLRFFLEQRLPAVGEP